MPLTGDTPYNSFVPGEPWVTPGRTLSGGREGYPASGDEIDATLARYYFTGDPALPREVAVAGSFEQHAGEEVVPLVG